MELCFPSDEAILEEMIGPNRPWDDLHHISYLLPELNNIKLGEFIMTVNGDSPCHVKPLDTHRIYAEGNMESIAEKNPIDISRIPSVVEYVFVKEDYSPEDIHIYIKLYKKNCDLFS
jgi:hypothetical protein